MTDPILELARVAIEAHLKCQGLSYAGYVKQYPDIIAKHTAYVAARLRERLKPTGDRVDRKLTYTIALDNNEEGK